MLFVSGGRALESSLQSVEAAGGFRELRTRLLQGQSQDEVHSCTDRVHMRQEWSFLHISRDMHLPSGSKPRFVSPGW